MEARGTISCTYFVFVCLFFVAVFCLFGFKDRVSGA